MESARYFFATYNIIFNYTLGTNNVDQNQSEDITGGIIKIAKTFTKKHPKINIIITGKFPRDKMYSFSRTPIDETTKILKVKCKNLQQTYCVNQDDDWVKNFIK